MNKEKKSDNTNKKYFVYQRNIEIYTIEGKTFYSFSYANKDNKLQNILKKFECVVPGIGTGIFKQNYLEINPCIVGGIGTEVVVTSILDQEPESINCIISKIEDEPDLIKIIDKKIIKKNYCKCVVGGLGTNYKTIVAYIPTEENASRHSFRHDITIISDVSLPQEEQDDISNYVVQNITGEKEIQRAFLTTDKEGAQKIVIIGHEKAITRAGHMTEEEAAQRARHATEEETD